MPEKFLSGADMHAQKIINGAPATNPTDFVILSQITGVNVADYNAATNVPDIEAGTGVLEGNIYRVTAAGLFFTESVQAGDALIARINNPTALADWIVVNKNIPDLVDASETAKGLIEIADQPEVDAEVDDSKAVTPLKLKNYLDSKRFTQTGLQIGAAQGIQTVPHNLNTRYVNVHIYDAASFQPYRADWIPNTVNTVTIEGLGATVTTNVVISKVA